MGKYVLGMRVDPVSYDDVIASALSWARGGQSHYVCVANVHMTMEAYDDRDFRSVVNGASIVTPDGMPLVWALRGLGIRTQERVYGPDLTLYLCDAAAKHQVPVALYGGTEASLADFTTFLRRRCPDLIVSSAISPPFRPLTSHEDEAFTRQLAESGAGIILVGTGCPKQERWMAEHKGRIPAVMVGVGAAFDFHSGRVKQAPSWMQRTGLEWLFRFLMEPRRLWKRYLKHNPRFVVLFLLQLLGLRRFREV